jgi:hypothetical protein
MYTVKTYKMENRSGSNAEGFFRLLLARIFFLSPSFFTALLRFTIRSGGSGTQQKKK